MYTKLLEQLGLAKNEARIYETLLREGECSVGHISNKSGVYRRNVYDSLQRLMEKGLVFEILQKQENRYQAVNPNKLKETLQEKEQALDKILPDLERLFSSTPLAEAVYIYRGWEGCKNYMRDILLIGEDNYVIGGKGLWAHPKLRPFLLQFAKEANKKKIKFYNLADHELKGQLNDMTKVIDITYRFLSKEYSSSAGLDVFGDRVVIHSNAKYGEFKDDMSMTVIINQSIADACRIWFKLMWDTATK